jgi:hypothetical protein
MRPENDRKRIGRGHTEFVGFLQRNDRYVTNSIGVRKIGDSIAGKSAGTNGLCQKDEGVVFFAGHTAQFIEALRK